MPPTRSKRAKETFNQEEEDVSSTKSQEASESIESQKMFDLTEDLLRLGSKVDRTIIRKGTVITSTRLKKSVCSSSGLSKKHGDVMKLKPLPVRLKLRPPYSQVKTAKMNTENFVPKVVVPSADRSSNEIVPSTKDPLRVTQNLRKAKQNYKEAVEEEKEKIYVDTPWKSVQIRCPPVRCWNKSVQGIEKTRKFQ